MCCGVCGEGGIGWTAPLRPERGGSYRAANQAAQCFSSFNEHLMDSAQWCCCGPAGPARPPLTGEKTR